MIDWKRVQELRDEIGADDFLEVAGMFLEESDQTVIALSGPLTSQDAESLLHFLKGSALNLGLADLAAVCQAGERLAASGDGAAIDVAAIIAVYQASKTAFLAGNATESAA
jgi:histidine phosphotransfer protein HptB